MGWFPKKFKKQSKNKSTKPKKHVHFAPTPHLTQRHPYDFDWSLENLIWYNRTELNDLKEQRFEEADALRHERGISSSSRDDADKIADGREKDIWVGDTITHALDDTDDGPISVRGIEHFVWPVLQKEMISRKKDLKRFVVEYSQDKRNKALNPRERADRLAAEAMERSAWARNVASERGIKYCQYKRGGSLFRNTHAIVGKRRLSVRGSMTRRNSLIPGMRNFSVKKMSGGDGGANASGSSGLAASIRNLSVSQERNNGFGKKESMGIEEA